MDAFTNYFGIDPGAYRVEHMPDAIVLWDKENGRLGYRISLEDE